MSYASESAALDAELLDVIGAWHRHERALNDAEFDDVAQRIFAYQLRWNAPYARYCASLGVSLEAMPATWRDIPPAPTTAFKDATLATFDSARAALAFETSGTTLGIGGMHYMETPALYDAVLLAGFDRFMLRDGARLRYLNLVPNPADRPQSSLGYMMAKVALERGDGRTGWYVRGDDLFVEALLVDCRKAVTEGAPVCIAGTAFALVQLCDTMAQRNESLNLPNGSRVMETGGFKGRSRVVSRNELYEMVARRFGIERHAIVAEYGMTELTSQWYDAAPRDGLSPARRFKRAPTWLRARVVDAGGRDVPDGVVGALVHVDLANRSSCLAIQTEDLGAVTPAGLLLIGREEGASLRGCSLDAETLRTR